MNDMQKAIDRYIEHEDPRLSEEEDDDQRYEQYHRGNIDPDTTYERERDDASDWLDDEVKTFLTKLEINAPPYYKRSKQRLLEAVIDRVKEEMGK